MKTKLAYILLGTALVMGGVGSLPCVAMAMSAMHDCCKVETTAGFVNVGDKCCSHQSEKLLPFVSSINLEHIVDGFVVVAAVTSNFECNAPSIISKTSNAHWGGLAVNPSIISTTRLLL